MSSMYKSVASSVLTQVLIVLKKGYCNLIMVSVTARPGSKTGAPTGAPWGFPGGAEPKTGGAAT